MLHFARWKLVLVLLVSVAGVLLAIPNLLSTKTLSGIPDWIPHKQINLGLDLQGGMHLVLEVQVEKAVEASLDGIADDIKRTVEGKDIVVSVPDGVYNRDRGIVTRTLQWMGLKDD